MDANHPTHAEAARYRLFIALPVPQAVKQEIQLVQERFRRELPEGCARWTRPEQWHLTLRFLGNVDAARVGALTLMSIEETCRLSEGSFMSGSIA